MHQFSILCILLQKTTITEYSGNNNGRVFTYHKIEVPCDYPYPDSLLPDEAVNRRIKANTNRD